MDGYVAAFSNKSFLAKSIQRIAKTKWNHVEIISDSIAGWLSSGSVDNGFIPIMLTKKIKDLKYGEDFIVFKPIYESFNGYETAIEVQENWRRRKYDYRGLLIVQLLWNTLGLWVGARNERRALKRLYYYEAVWYFHREAHLFKKWWKGKPEYTFPEDKFTQLTEEEFNSML